MTSNTPQPTQAVPKLGQPASTSRFQKFHFWFLIPAIIIVPVWVGLGRTLFEVGGWGEFLTIIFYAPVLFVYHIVLLTLTLVKDWRRRAVHLSTMWLLTAYYVLAFINQLAFIDGGDTLESVNSVLTKWFGLSENVSTFIFEASFYSGIIIAIATVVNIIILLASQRKQAYESPGTQSRAA